MDKRKKGAKEMAITTMNVVLVTMGIPLIGLLIFCTIAIIISHLRKGAKW